MAKKNIKPANRVRFAWWGAEESGLVGATRYVAAISDEEFAKIATNLNFDMLASPNHANFVLRRRLLDTTAAGHRAGRQPGRGVDRAGVRRLLRLASASPTEPTAFDGRSDYKPFQDNGVAAGGLFPGAEVAKTAGAGARSGAASPVVAFDPCYHQACDDIDNLDTHGYEQTWPTAARDRRRRVRHGPQDARSASSRSTRLARRRSQERHAAPRERQAPADRRPTATHDPRPSSPRTAGRSSSADATRSAR